jgi:hypothetical protein
MRVAMNIIVGIMVFSIIILASWFSPKGGNANAGDVVDLAGKDTTAIVCTVSMDKNSIAWAVSNLWVT